MPSSRRSYGYVPADQPGKPPKRPTGIVSRIFSTLFSLLSVVASFLFRCISFGFRGIFLFLASPRIRKKLFPLAITGVVFLILSAVITIAWASKDLPDPNKLTDRTIAQSTKIYDRTGEHLLYEIFAEEKRTLVTLDQIPQPLIDGVIATEDASFYEHHGIRPLSIVRSVVYGVLGKGRIGGGASTLTQQLVKNAILTRERKLTRKLKEFILSVRLEQKYTKEQILQIYFNEIPYGSTNYGVESAAQSYFGKTVSELNLAESATLAGLPQAPSYFLSDHDALRERRNFVLRRMYEEGYISEQEKNAAQETPLTLSQEYGDIKAPHFVLYVKQQLVDTYGEQTVDTGGLKVITSLDWEKQQIAEDIIGGEIGKAALSDAGANNTALVAMDPKTGHILTMVGSQDFYNPDIGGQFNVATQANRQPGSSLKPIIYAAAFEKGYTPETVLYDVRTNFSPTGEPYIPENYDLQERGPVTIRQALQGSLNIPAVKAMYLVGEKEAISFTERLGYTTFSNKDLGLSLVLGGGGVNLLEHVSAYGTMANEGKRTSAVSILRVEDATGSILEEWKEEKPEQVVDKQVALTLSQVLSDDAARAYVFGAGGILTLPGRPVAAKTGTTNNYVDSWTVGYTPSIVTGVWAGNSNNSPMKRGFGGSRVAGTIWNAFMKQALDGAPVEQFSKPEPTNVEKAVLRGADGGSITLLVDSVTGKLATSSTPEKYIVTRTYLQGHSILHYVQKDNPRGPVPEHPEEDPQYSVWEAAIQDWIQRKKESDPTWNISFEEPPTEADDIHSLELIPSLEIVYPIASSTITSREINTDIRVSAPRGVSRVLYKIDGEQVSTVKQHPFNLQYFARTLSYGKHLLSITVEDDVGNTLTEEIPFFFEIEQESASLLWQSGNQLITMKDFPRTFTLFYTQPEHIVDISITAIDESGNPSPVATITNPNATQQTTEVRWDNPPKRGVYLLRAQGTTEDGTVIEDTITITITS